MAILQTLIWNLLAPAVLSASAIALARRLGRNAASGRRGRWGVAVGLGLGYFAGHLGVLGWPGIPTLDAKEWVAWLVLAAMLLGILESGVSLPGVATWGLRGLFVAGTLGLLLRSKMENAWTLGESVAWLGGLWLVLLISWWNLEAQAERLSGPGWVVPVGLVSAGWVVVQVLGGGASLGQLEGVLTSTLLGALLTVGLRPGSTLSKGGTAVVWTVLAGLGLTGYYYSEVPAPVALLLVAAPWAPWVDRVGFIRRRSYWTRASVRFLTVLLTVGVAVFLADSSSTPRPDDGSGL